MGEIEYSDIRCEIYVKGLKMGVCHTEGGGARE